jgi:hypothetical protein
LIVEVLALQGYVLSPRADAKLTDYGHHSIYYKVLGPLPNCMQDEDIILLEDTPEPEDAQQRTEEAERQPEPEFSITYSEYPIPSVKADVTVPDHIGYPCVYHHIESPSSSRSVYRRDIIHHKDILLKHLPNPNLRANYIFSQACNYYYYNRGVVTAVGGGSVSSVFLARLGKPEVKPVLLLWERWVIEDHPRRGYLVEELGTLYGSRIPKEDWELHYRSGSVCKIC